MKKQILLGFFIAVMAIQALAQANRRLSNLLPTQINEHLIPIADTFDLGSSAITWRILYLNGYISLDGGRFVSNQGTQSTFVGYQAGNENAASSNSGFGYRSLFNNTGGSFNTANGTNALRANTTGAYNTAHGSFSLYKNIQGNWNTANGYSALYSNFGNSNTADGAYALSSNTFGYENTATGFNSMYLNTSGYYNVASGSYALNKNINGNTNTADGVGALSENKSGNCNTAVGYLTLSTNTTGNYNTAIGCNADMNTSGLTNATAIGSGTKATASNQVMLGNTSVTSVKAAGSFVIMSDGRFKNNRKENVPGLDFIKELKPVTYNYDIHKLNNHIRGGESKANPSDRSPDCCSAEKEEAIANKEKKLYTGFVAQEVEVAANKLGYDFSGVYKPENDKDAYGLSYSDFVVPLVKAVQELSGQNEDLQKQIDDLKKMINTNPNNIISFNGAALEQNIPNPFTNSTTINYTLPQKFTNAQIVITDKNGKLLKQQSISGSSKGAINIDASTLVAGAYNYSLIVDGRVISSKQMVLTK